ncbi:helix-turn-helix domain-containing protein [Victivallis vadensis]|uniref:helix-turn-helix domain-containing protein n=1 Tax=Victivallis vadensis TaxID=172901 RepID=UPI003D0632C9
MLFYKEAFRILRESRGLTFEEIGKQLGVSKQSVSNWENLNKTDRPRPKRIYELAKILGCSAIDISDLKPEYEIAQLSHEAISKSFGERLKEIREKKKITQAELAKKTGIKQSAISSYENDKYMPNIENLRAICNALSVSAADLDTRFMPLEVRLLEEKDNIGVGNNAEPDKFLQEILDVWPKLSKSSQMKVAAFAVELLEKSGAGASEEIVGEYRAASTK